MLFFVKMSNCMSSSCAPPHPMWCVAVSCFVLPPILSMGLPSCCRCCWYVSGNSVISVFWGKQLWFCEVFIILFILFVTISIQQPSRKICLGNAAHPPTFPTNHMLYNQFMHTPHTHRNPNPPTCLTPALGHPYRTYSETQPPTHSKPTHPLIPPSFFRFQLGWFNHHKRLGYIHSTRERSVAVPFWRTYTILSSPQHMKRTRVREDNLTSEASRLSTCDPEQLVELQTQKPKHIPPA